ncbi:outer membrane protein assembly factor [Sinirhodobacter populi]|uniref:Outer membrane protein assembly factor n=1 Tax=Paenirhodobacter populi TaxID=2306993 RepID=A0A443K7A5_9RHOB|nr:outer membrane protein assembly factor [Sinirhodobacter populi]
MGAQVFRSAVFLSAGLFALTFALSAEAKPAYSFEVPGVPDDIADAIKGASLTRDAMRSDEETGAQDLFASARADYERIIGVLYARGYYAGSISILLDGREAAGIEPMDAPQTIGRIDIRVLPGPRFTFARAAIGPLAGGTQLPSGYRQGETAGSGTIIAAARAGVDAWREDGHAKAAVRQQQITANHRTETVSSDIVLDPGPEAHFGILHARGNQRLRTERLLEIAGYPTGRRYTPERIEEVRARLRRTGIFSSVTLVEADKLRDGDLLDGDLTVVEERRRRMGAGIEYGSSEGLTLSAYWLHRNLLGGGERLRWDAEISGIGGTTGGTDYSLGVRLDRPATFSPDTSAFVTSTVARTHEEDYTQDAYSVGVGLAHIFNERLSGQVAIQYDWQKVTDDSGDTIYRQISWPSFLLWDNRDNVFDAKRGYYGRVGATPFYGLGDSTGSGMQLTSDLRAYKAFGAEGRFVLAGRAQIGGVFGPSLEKTPRDYLFYSGGGGTVRGQPYQSLGVRVLENGTLKTGGGRFAAFSGEFRAGLTESIGVVAFYDAGYVGTDDYFNDSGEWQSGAGVGLRYATPIGPIRLDLAGPVSGSTGDGAQIYLGIGQAF